MDTIRHRQPTVYEQELARWRQARQSQPWQALPTAQGLPAPSQACWQPAPAATVSAPGVRDSIRWPQPPA